jgi:phenylacetyl-CoA:acceptor oxidoreductase 27-kDa subunit
MTRWGMVIDLRKCIGCYACMIACKEEHFLPPGMFWSRVLIGETGAYPSVTKQVYPVNCNHCKEAACVKACPTRATTRRPDGIVNVDSEKCVGCRYCLVSCPYQQRTYLADNTREYFPGQGFTEFEIIGRQLYPLQKGTVVKCTFCAERIDAGLKKGLKPGLDREATPACVITCAPQARYFGDLDNPDSAVSRLLQERRGFQLHPEYGTDPSVYYIT